MGRRGEGGENTAFPVCIRLLQSCVTLDHWLYSNRSKQLLRGLLQYICVYLKW